jgi:hypothetical protein
MNGGEPPLLEDQLKERAQQELRQAQMHHESHIQLHSNKLLSHLNAAGGKGIQALAEFKGKHYRLRVDVLPPWYARLYKWINTIKDAKK